MWEGLLPASALRAVTQRGSELVAWLVWNGAIPKVPLHKVIGGGGCCSSCFFMENHGIQHMFWLMILFIDLQFTP